LILSRPIGKCRLPDGKEGAGAGLSLPTRYGAIAITSRFAAPKHAKVGALRQSAGRCIM
jgi:hypothetical protein